MEQAKYAGRKNDKAPISTMFDELLNLRTTYNVLAKEIISRGLESAKEQGEEWADQKIEALKLKIDDIKFRGKRVISKAKTLGKGVAAKFKAVDNKVLAARIEHAIKRKEAVRKAKQYFVDKKDNVIDSIEEKKELAGLYIEVAKDKVDNVKENLTQKKDNAKEAVKRTANAVKENVSEKAEKAKETAKKSGMIALGLGVMGAEYTIKGAKTLGKGVAAKFKAVDNKVLATRIEYAIKRKEAMRKAKQYFVDKKDSVVDSIREKKELAGLYIEVAKDKVESVKDNLTQKKDKVKETVKKGVHDIKDVKYRIETRKNDTLKKALDVGEKFSKELLAKIQGSIYSKQEQVQMRQQTVDAKIATNDRSVQGPEME